MGAFAAPGIIVTLNLKFAVTFSFSNFSLLQRAGIERKMQIYGVLPR